MYNKWILISLVTVLVACKKEQPAGSGNKPENAGPPKAMKVDGIIVHDEFSTGKLTTTGNVLPNEEIELKSEVSGKITGIHFKEGTFVKQGQLLV